ncbi:MAG TPA: lamin tail domain-containing protein, partial [Longimicrobiales bacterium]|nr:lamin tail domain-containing protein [Longimicrobiales bacterium]
EEPVEITFLDVGQGDAVLLRAPDGRAALVDAGPGVDLVPELERRGVARLELMVASHPHADHIGGMRRILTALPVGSYMDNGQPYTTATYLTLMRELRARPEVRYLEAVPRTLALGAVRIRVLPLPDPGENPNERSVALVVEYGAFRAFLSGDSEAGELAHFVRAGVVPDVTLLKAPHHGSDDAVWEPFLAEARPEVVVVSVGRGNTYGHPRPAALLAYARHAERVLRTDLAGTITVRGYEDGSYEVEAERGAVAQSGGAAAGAAAGVAVARPVAVLPGVAGAPATAREAVGAPAAAVRIRVFADAPGNDHRNPNGEYARLENASGAPMDLDGWRLCDAARHCFTFPQGARIAAGAAVVVYTGSGTADGTRFYMGSGAAVWNNDGDTATLYDPAGRVAATHVY